MKTRLGILICTLLFSSLSAHAYRARPVSIDLQYHTFEDIVNDPENPKLSLSETIGANINLRFYRVFSFVLSGFTASDSSLEAFGLGLRIDLPGIFFFSGASNDFVRRKKKRGTNTYLQWTKYAVSEGTLDTFVADRIGFGIDFFTFEHTPFEQAYLNFELMTYSHQGNQFLALGAGIGYEF